MKPTQEAQNHRIEFEETQRSNAITRILENQFYADDELNFIIASSLPENTSFASTAVSAVPEQLQQAIEEFTDSTHRSLVVPLHIHDNHFVGLYIERVEGGFRIFYIDPTGNQEIPDNISDAISEVFEDPEIEATTNTIQHSQDGIFSNNHCGAYTAEILTSLASGDMRIVDGRLQGRVLENVFEDVGDYDGERSNLYGIDIRKQHLELMGGISHNIQDLTGQLETSSIGDKRKHLKPTTLDLQEQMVRDLEIKSRYESFLAEGDSDDSDSEIETGKRISDKVVGAYKIQHQIDGGMVIPVFRGTKFLPSFFDSASRRRASLLTDHSKLDIYSNMSFRNSGLSKIDIGKYSAGGVFDIAKLEECSDKIVQFFRALAEIKDVNIKVNSKYLYEIHYFLLQINTNLYDKFDEMLENFAVFLADKTNKDKYKISDETVEIIKQVFIDAFSKDKKPVADLPDKKPLISTGIDSGNAAKYALPIIIRTAI